MQVTDRPTTTLASLGVDFAARVYEAERRLIAAGWIDPVGLHDAACRYGLCGKRFGDPRCGFLYSFLATCAERGIHPTVDLCLRVVEFDHTAPLGRKDKEWTWCVIHETPTRSQDLDDYVRGVVRLADFRQRTAKHHVTELARTMIDEDHFEIVVRPKQQTRPRTTNVPQRLCKRARRRGPRYAA